MGSFDINVLPAEPSDFLSIARIEAISFEHDPIIPQIFGPHNEASILHRASVYGNPGVLGEVIKYTKAVVTDEKGKNNILGFARWCLYSASQAQSKAQEDEKDIQLPPVPCPELFRDTIMKGEVLMAKSCEGKPYLSEYIYILSSILLYLQSLSICPY